MARSKNSKRMMYLAWAIVILASIGSAQAVSYVDLVGPSDGAWINTENITFDFYPQIEGGVDECNLEVNGSFIQISNVTNSQINTFTTNAPPQGSYTWRMHCSNSNQSAVSEERTFTVDKEAPGVTINQPEEDAVTGREQNFTFTPTDNLDDSLACQLNIDNSTRKNVSSESGVEKAVRITDLESGNHTWQVSCKDSAGNEGTSSQGDFKTTVANEFSVSLNKQEYKIGEEALLTADAPDGTNLSLEICPDGDGFVECYAALTMEENTYPREESLPYTNQTGKYIVDAFFNYKGETEKKQVNYTVVNNIQVSITGPTNVKTGEEVILTGSAEGGTGSLSYEWKLHNGTSKQGREVKMTYTRDGDFTEKLTVKDEADNKVAETVNVKAKKAYQVTVNVKDKDSKKALRDATVELGNEEGETGTNGQVTLNVREGNRDLKAFKDGYEFQEKKVKVDGKKTFNVELERKNKTNETKKLSLSLTKPTTGVSVTSGKQQFRYEVSGVTNATCTLLWKEDKFQERAQQVMNTDGEKAFEIEIEEGRYEWRVECEQDGTSQTTPARRITVESDNEAQGSASTDGLDKNGMLGEMDKVLQTYSSMSTRERNVADKLGYHEQANDVVKKIQRASRDIHDLSYRTDMTDAEKEKRRKSIIENTTRQFQNTVKDVRVKDSKSFVNYPTGEELEPVVEAYAESEGYKGKLDAIMEAFDSLQGKIVVSTKATIVEVERLDGSRETVTAVIKEVKTENTTRQDYLMEYIPKEVAETAGEVRVRGDYEVVKEDPVLRFEVQDEIVYSVKGRVDLNKVKESKTALAREGLSTNLKGITGSATGFMPDVNLGKQGLLLLAVIVLLIAYLLYDSDVVGDLKNVFAGGSEKQLHYIKVLINDALDNLDVGNYDKASLIYREIKLSFDNLSPRDKKEVYEEVMGLVNKMDIAYSRQLSEKIDEALEAGDKRRAENLYKRLKATYRKLDEDYKKEIYDKVTAITGRLQ